MISRQEIQQFVDDIVKRFRPSKVILFGSYAYGAPNEDSDVDLMVVMRHRGSDLDLATRMRPECPRAFRMDLLVRSPAEVNQRLKIGDTFMQDVTTNGVVLHDADHA